MKPNDLIIDEVWKAVPIKGLKNHYEVSTSGRVRRSAGGKGTHAGRIITGGINGGGYRQVDLCKGGVDKVIYLHRLIAVTFVPNPEGKPEVNHLSGVKTDNSADNLAWATKKENLEHAARMGLLAHGERVHTAKLTAKNVAKIRSEIAGEKGRKRANKVRELAARYGVTRAAIRDVVRGRTWKHCLKNQQHEAPVAVGGQLVRPGQDAIQRDNPIVTSGNSETCVEMVV